MLRSFLARLDSWSGETHWLRLLVGTSLIFLALLPPGIYSVDGNGMLAVAESIVEKHSLTVPPDLGMLGRGGQYYGLWYPLQSLLSVPFVTVAVPTSYVTGLPIHYVAAFFVLVLPVIFTGATTALVALISRHLGASVEGAWLAALSYSFGTIALAYVRTFYADPLLTLLTAASLYLVLRGAPKEILAAGVLTGLAVLAKPTGVLVGLLISACSFMTKRSGRMGLVPAAGSLVGLIFYCLYNEFRFGNPLTFGQPWSFDMSSIPKGIVGLTVSPGRGLIWYCPPVVLGFFGFFRARKSNLFGALSVGVLFAGFLFLHSLWTAWHGGWSWGPRFLLPALPGICAIAGLVEEKWRKALVVLTLLGFLVNAPTLVSSYERYYAESSENGVSESDMLWSASRAPLLHAWPAAVRQISDAHNQDVRDLFFRRGSSPSTTIASSRALRIVPLWWWVLPIARIPRSLGAGVSLVLVILGCLILWHLPARGRGAPHGLSTSP